MITAGEFLERVRAREWVLDIMFVWYMWLVTHVNTWFMALPNPTTAQATHVTVITGILGVMTALYGQLRVKA